MSTRIKLSVMADGVLVISELRGDKVMRSEMHEVKLSKPTAAKIEAFINRRQCGCSKTRS